MLHVDDEISRQTRKTQRKLFRLAKFNLGLTRKMIASDSGIPYSTLGGYEKGEVIMPITAVIRLAGIIPDNLLSLLFAPADRHLEQDDCDGDEQFDDLADAGDELARAVRQARHPKSPGGTEIIAIEEAQIRQLRDELKRRVKAA